MMPVGVAWLTTDLNGSRTRRLAGGFDPLTMYWGWGQIWGGEPANIDKLLIDCAKVCPSCGVGIDRDQHIIIIGPMSKRCCCCCAAVLSCLARRTSASASLPLSSLLSCCAAAGCWLLVWEAEADEDEATRRRGPLIDSTAISIDRLNNFSKHRRSRAHLQIASPNSLGRSPRRLDTRTVDG